MALDVPAVNPSLAVKLCRGAQERHDLSGRLQIAASRWTLPDLSTPSARRVAHHQVTVQGRFQDLRQ